MKKILFAAFTLLLLTLLELPVCAAPMYISMVEAAAVPRTQSAREDAEAAAKAKGCEYVLDYDFNKYSGGDYVVLGFTRTDDVNKALHSLVFLFLERGQTPPDTYDVDGTEFRLASTTNFNSGTSLESAFLYYTTEPKEGSPLKELYTEDNYKEPGSGDYMRILINGADNKSALDYHATITDDEVLEPHCFLYRDYDKDYWKTLDQESGDFPSAYIQDAEKGGWMDIRGFGSVFSNHPVASSLICLTAIVLLCGIAALIIVKRRRKKEKEQ